VQRCESRLEDQKQAMGPRATIPSDVVADVLTASRRRCCVCFALRSDDTEKRGQIAHLDQDRSNNSKDNLAFLCLEHHDQYDSKTSQSKGITMLEVKRYRTYLYESLASLLANPPSPSSAPPSPMSVIPVRLHLYRTEAEALNYSPRTALVRFSITNLSDDLLKLVSLIVRVLAKNAKRRFRLPAVGAPHDEYKLSADLSVGNVVEILDDVRHQFILKPRESDAFSLALFGNEGYEYKIIIVCALESIEHQERGRWTTETQPITISYPIRTVEGYRDHGNLSD